MNPKPSRRKSNVNQRKELRRTLDQDFIDGAAKRVTQEGYSLAVATKGVYVPYMTLRQWCQKQSAKKSALGSSTSDKVRVEQLEAEIRQLRKQLRQAELESEILKKATADFANESQ